MWPDKFVVKICGIRTPAAAHAAINAGADLLGFIFYPLARRAVTSQYARTILKSLNARSNIGVVGVFVNPNPSEANQIADDVNLDYIQLSGDEPAIIFSQFNRPIIKAVRLSPTITQHLPRDSIQAIILEPAAAGIGGAGISHDLTQARTVTTYQPRPPILLAGGLRPETVADAIITVHPDGVDVSSGVERDGHQDEEQIFSFIQNARGAVTWQ